MKCKRGPVVIFGGLMLCTIAHAQGFWQKVNGPPGGSMVMVLVADLNGHLYAGSRTDGIFRSTNNGETWTPINNGLKSSYIGAIASGAQGQLYVGVSGVYRSTDGGEHWEQTDTSIAKLGISALAVNARGDIFAGASFVRGSSSVFRSTDNGATWIPMGDSVDVYDVRSIAINPQGHVFVGGEFGIYRSTDNGATWLRKQNGIFSGNSRMLVAGSNGYLFSASGNGVYRSQDNGDSWQLLRNGLTYDDDPVSLALGPNGEIFAGTTRGLCRSTDYGESWYSISQGSLTAYHLAQGIVVGKNGFVWIGTYNGVFRAQRPAFHWEYSSTGMKEASIFAMTFNQNGDLLAGTGVGIFKAASQSESWTLIEASPFANAFASSPDQKIYAGTTSFGLFVSADGGENWTKVQSYPENAEARILAINALGHIFVGGFRSALFRSTDDGKSWTWLRLVAAPMAITNDNVIFLGNVFRSADNGDHWQLVTSGMVHRDVNSLAADSQGRVFAATTGGGVYRTTDNGDHWNATALVDEVRAMSINTRDHIFAQSRREGVLRSRDGGDRWEAIGLGLNDATVASFVFSPSGFAYAITNRGLYRSVESTTAVQESPDNLPVAFELHQNYPNPFNPTTTIQFSLPRSGRATLKVYNTLGEEVATLVSGNLPAGEHRVKWTAESFGAGIYLYRLQSGGLIETRKLVLLR